MDSNENEIEKGKKIPYLTKSRTDMPLQGEEN